MTSERGGATKRGEVYSTLAHEIVSGILAPGTPLSERALGERFSLSRTPIRQVIWQLERDLLVDIYEHRGAFVAKMGASEILELFQLREALEPVAAMLAASHRPNDAIEDLENRLIVAHGDPSVAAPSLIALGEELHDSLVVWSGNRMLSRIYESIGMQTRLLRNLLHNAAGVESDSLREHLAILDAVKWRDKWRARRAMTYHLQRAKIAIIEELFGTTDRMEESEGASSSNHLLEHSHAASEPIVALETEGVG